MDARQRLMLALVALVAVFAIGTTGYVLLEGVRPGDAAYMTLITLSTVGYTEVFPLSPAGRLWTAAVIVLGIGVVSVAFTSLVSVFVGGEVRDILGRRRVQNKIEHLSDHVILCGFGRMGTLAATRLRDQGSAVVVIEARKGARVDLEAAGLLYVIGDAMEEDTLAAAGLERASALVTALPTDADNVFVTLTAHGLRPDMQIIARAEQPGTEGTLLRAGASRVVCPQIIGATRISHILTRPNIVDFFDVAAQGVELEMDEYRVGPDSPLREQSLRNAALPQSTGATVIAIKRADGRSVFQPDPDEVIREGDLLILIGRAGTSIRLDRLNR